jgi:hypothetical protein
MEKCPSSRYACSDQLHLHLVDIEVVAVVGIKPDLIVGHVVVGIRLVAFAWHPVPG